VIAATLLGACISMLMADIHRFVIGDSITVNGHSGLLEALNLLQTQQRQSRMMTTGTDTFFFSR